jgi:hypothetical protein
MERNALKERLMNKDDKNRHFVLLIIDISKKGAKEMGHVKMAGPSFNILLTPNMHCVSRKCLVSIVHNSLD